MSTFRFSTVTPLSLGVYKGTAALLATAMGIAGLLPFVGAAPASAAPKSVGVIVQKAYGAGNVPEQLVKKFGGNVTMDLSIINGFAATIDESKIPALEQSNTISYVTEDAPVHPMGLLGDTLGGVVGGVTNTVDQAVAQTLGDTTSVLLPTSENPVVAGEAEQEKVDNPTPVVEHKPSPVDATTGATSVYQDEIGATNAHAAGVTGKGVTVALIDTGVTSIPDLASRLVKVKAPNGASKNCVNLSGDPTCKDNYGHGTFIAGLIAGTGANSNGEYAGVAPDANILSIKIAGRDGSASVGKIIYAIQWVAQYGPQYGVKVLNLSLGTDSTQSYKLDPLNYAVERAWGSGISVVVAAGNSGDHAGTISKPADDPLVITTGAVDDLHTTTTSDDIVPTFSSRGPTAADGLTKPDIATPGTLLISTRAPGSAIEEQYPGGGVDATYRRGSGTSQSAGVLSGSIALLLQKYPNLTPNQVKYAITHSATDIANASGSNTSDPNAVGAGLLNIGSAIDDLPVGEANQGVKLGTGRGSLGLSQGSIRIAVKDGQSVLGVLGGALPIKQGDTSDPTGLGWYGTGWYGGGWYGGGWYGTGWYGTGWYGGGWYGGGWYGGGWYGGGWYGSGWYGVWD